MGKWMGIIICTIGLSACSQQTAKEFIKETEAKFQPEHSYGDVIVYDRFNAMLVPEIQNYIKDGSVTCKVISYEDSYSSLGSGSSEEMKGKAFINYKWRKIDDYNEGFKKLFPIDHVIASSYVNDDDSESGKTPFILYRVVERDDNNDGVIEEHGDKISLFLFDLRNFQLKQISPKGIHVKSVNHSGLTYSGIYSGTSNSASMVANTAAVGDLRIENYIVIFTGIENDVASTYMYNVKKGVLEKLKYE